MLHEKMEKAINDQINAELYSAYLYLSMASYTESLNLSGFTNWLRIQFQEEQDHAMKFFDFVLERGGKVTLQPIEGPPSEWPSPLALFEAVYEHEQKVTGLINQLMDLAIELSDHASRSLLNWFVDEQVEEEASADDIVQQLRLVGDQGHGLFMVDKDLGTRVYTPPAAEA
jgi:ferritin